jgi:hypothetical protein
MESILQYAYFERTCPACGGSFALTMLDIVNEYQVHREWQPGRPPCSICAFESRGLLTALPEPVVANLAQAWAEVVRASATAGLELHVGARPAPPGQ